MKSEIASLGEARLARTQCRLALTQEAQRSLTKEGWVSFLNPPYWTARELAYDLHRVSHADDAHTFINSHL